MKTKLNLSVDPVTLQIAKQLAKENNTSVSQLFESYIRETAEKNAMKKNSPTKWLESFQERNKKQAKKISDKDIEKWLAERVEKK